MIKNESFDLIFNALPISAVLLKPDINFYKIENINQAYIDCLEIAKENYIGKNIEQLYGYISSNVDSKKFLKLLLKSLNEVKQYHKTHKFNEEVFYYLADTPDVRLKKYVALENKPILDENNELIYILQIITDISESEYSKIEIDKLSLLKSKNLAELENTKNELSRIMDYSADMICTINELGYFVLVSQACKKILGYKPEELIGKISTSIIHESSLKNSNDIVTSIREGDELKNFLNICIRKDGSTVPLLWSVKWIEEQQRYYCICKDAQERVAYENQLTASEKKYKNLFDNNPAPMLIWDVETLEILDCNEEAATLYGFSKAEFLNLTLKQITQIKDYPLLQNSIDQYSKDGEIYKGIWKSVKKDKTFIYVDFCSHIISYNHKKASLLTLIDVSKRVALVKQQHFDRLDKDALINNSDDAIWSVNKDFKLIAANKVLLEKLKTLTNKDFKTGDLVVDNKLFPVKFLKQWKEFYKQALKNNSFKKIITNKYLNEDDLTWTEISFNPIFNKGEVTGVACRSTDITQKKISEEALKRSEENLSEAQKLAKIGSWEIDLVNNTTNISDELYRILEIEKTNAVIYPSFLFDLIANEDKSLKQKLSLEATLNGTSFNQEFRIITPKGNKKILKESGYGKKSAKGIVYKLFGTVQDITEIKNLELIQQELLEKQRLLFSIVTSTDDAIISKTLEGIITSWNNGAEKMFNFKEEDIIGKDIKLITPKHLLLEERKITASIINGTNIQNFETIRKDKNGKEINVSLTNSPIYNIDGKMIGVSEIIRDVSEKKKSQLQLLNAYKEKETILESIGDAFFAIDNNFAVTYWNKKAAKELHTPAKAIIGKKLFVDVFKELSQSNSAKQYRLALETKQQISFIDYYSTTQKYFDITAYPTENGLSVYFRNITTERRLQQQFEAVTQNMPGITYRCKIDKEWTMLFLSDGLKEITGYQPHQFINNNEKSFTSIIYPDDVESTNVLEEQLKINKVFNIQYRIICADNSIIWVEDIGKGVFDVAGKLEYIDGVILDITQRKADENKLHELNFELKNKTTKLIAINSELEQFAYVASHDLQEPLRMVTSFLTLLQNKYDNQLDDEGNKFIYFAVDGAKRMRKIILDLLEFSRVGKTNNNIEDVNLNLIIENITNLFIKKIEAGKVEIKSEKLPTLKNYTTPLQQVFSNLIGNALKYGATKINICYTENKTHFQFAVSDNGIGINPHYFDKIFIIFQRLHNKHEYSGTGIGLAITKKIVEGFGGKIWVESKEGEGSTFYFTILKNIQI